MPLIDAHGRPLRNLRLSVTDRCNLRCAYCMPETHYVWIPRHDILTFEETARLVAVFVSLGVDRVRITGGEPLMRADLPILVAQLAARERLTDLALTTNGVMLAALAHPLRDAGLRRVTVSLDTLRPDRFEALTRTSALGRTLAGIDAATEAFGGVKLDTVVMRGVNDDEIVPLVEFARARGAEIRFIEYMDVGGATRWSMDQVVTRAEILRTLGHAFGPVTPIIEDSSAPAERFRLGDGTSVGIIASTTSPFCGRCDRARLTADGTWLLCLYATHGLDLRALLRGGASDDEIRQVVTRRWTTRDDRGAERRLEVTRREALASVETLRQNRHLEMHRRGG
ncbi:MAG: GTP 3',8-cyclase MoaA [Acidobacteria bacterium]|nr:GTP 3',8-cyclase MoaA [Acidobacteriota bacterium]